MKLFLIIIGILVAVVVIVILLALNEFGRLFTKQNITHQEEESITN